MKVGCVEDCKETSPCGMLIHYTVDTSTDFVTYCDINGRGENRKSSKCEHCSWRALCKPTEPDFLSILSDALGREVTAREVVLSLCDI